MTETISVPPSPAANVRPQAPMEALDIIALITALMGLAVIPLILGLISRSEASKQGMRQHAVGTAGWIIGAIECAFWFMLWFFVFFLAAVGSTTAAGS